MLTTWQVQTLLQAQVATGTQVQTLLQVQETAPALTDADVVPNVAIIDALPACMEAENPALATSAVTSQGAYSLTPDLVQYLDDRVLVFASVPKKEQTIEYRIRVVAMGDFSVPPIEAVCMYDPMLASRYGGDRVSITQ